MPEPIYSRTCPTCPNILTYTRKQNFNKACRDNVKCRKCAHPRTSARHTKEVKPKTVGYWGEVQETYIKEYILAETKEAKNVIWEKLREPFQKMVSSIWHKCAPRCNVFANYTGDIEAQQEGYLKLLELFDKYEPAKGRFYTFATFCLDRFYKQQNMILMERLDKLEPLSVTNEETNEEITDIRKELATVDRLHNSLDITEYLGLFVQFIRFNFDKLVVNEKERKGLEGILKVLSDKTLDADQREVYEMFRSESGQTTHQLNAVLGRVRMLHHKLFNEYKNEGTIQLKAITSNYRVKYNPRKTWKVTLENLKTGVRETGLRVEIMKRLNLDSSGLSNLIKRRSKRLGVWKLVEVEEVAAQKL